MADKIQFNVDMSIDKKQLNQLKIDLENIYKLTEKDIIGNNSKMGLAQAKKELTEIKASARQVQAALTEAFNPKLGTINIAKLQSQLKELPLNNIYQNFQKAGAAGVQAFNQIPSAVMKTNLQLRESHSLLDRIGSTMTNTIKWGITSSVFNRLTESIQGAWNYTTKLDTSLNDIRIVTNKSADEMERFAVQANRAAQNLGSNTKSYTDAALIYYQQGLDDAQTKARTDVTVKTANVTGQSAQEVSEELTAIWNGYKVSASEAELYIDKVAKVAAGTAADLEEMATGMSKVASAANSAGVDIDQLNGMLSTVISVTREAPETVGTAFKTIFARLGDLSLGKTDEDGVGLGKVSGQLHNLGIEVLDQQGNMREMGKIVEDVAAKWQTWTQAQRQAAAVAMAGKLQYSRLIALFDNWDMYTNAVEMSTNAVGELQKQQNIYMESTRAHLNQLSASWERVFDSFVDNEGINSIIDVFSGAVNVLGNFIEAIGGGGQALATLGTIGINVFSKQIAESINASIRNMGIQKQNIDQLTQKLQTLEAIQSKLAENNRSDAGLNTRIDKQRQLNRYAGMMSKEEIEEAEDMIERLGDARSKQAAFEQQEKSAQTSAKKLLSQQGVNFTKGSLENALGVGTEEYEQVNQAIKDSNTSIDLYRQHLTELTRAQEQYQKALKEVVKTEEDSNEKKQEAAKKSQQAAAERLKEAYGDVKVDMVNMGARKDISSETKNAIKNATKQAMSTKMSSSAENVAQAVNDDIQNITSTVSQGINQIQTEVQSHAENFLNTADQVSSGVKEDIDGTVESLDNGLNSTFDEKKKEVITQSYVSIAGAIGQMASATMMFINLGNIWQNEDLSTGEKILQTFLALGTAIPLVVTGITSIKTASVSLATSFGYVAAAEGTATTGAVSFGAALWTALWPITAILATIAASIAIVVVMGNQIASAYNESANAAEAAHRQVEALTTAYTECKDAAEALKKTIYEYEESKDALEYLTKGTDEFREALSKANEKAGELIEKYELLAGIDYTVDSNGLINIKTGPNSGLDTKQQELDQKTNQLLQQTSAASIRAAQADIKSKTINYQRKTGIDYNSDIERGYDRTIGAMNLIPITGQLMVIGGQIGRASTETRGYNLTDSEVEELRKVLGNASEGYATILNQSEDSVRQWILNNKDLSQSVKDDVDTIVKQKDALVSLISATEEYESVIDKETKRLNLSHIQNNKDIADRVKTMSTDKEGQTNEQLQDLINQALSASLGGQAMALNEQTDLKIAKLRADQVKSNKDLENFAKNNGLDAEALGLTNLNDEKSAKAYLKHVLGYSDDDLAHIKIDDNWGKTTAKWDSNYTDSKGTEHKSSDEIYKDLNDEEARSAIAYQTRVKEISKQADENAKIFLEDSTKAIQHMLDSTQEMSNKYGIDLGNVILNSMAGRTGGIQDGKNADLDFSEAFKVLSDEEIEKLIKLTPEGLAQALHMTEDDFWNLGYEGAAAFEKAFDEALYEKERQALLDLMKDINQFGQNGRELSDDQRNALASQISEKMTATDMQDLSSNPLALNQIDFNTDKIDNVTEKLSFMAKSIRDARDEGVSLTAEQKEQAKELKYSENALRAYAEELENSNEALKDNDKVAADIALANVRMNKGIETLQKNWEDWSKVLKEGNKNSGEYYEVLSQLKEAAEQMFGVDVSNDFIQNAENMEKLKQLSEGNVEAFDELHEAAMRDYIAHLGIVGPDQASIDAVRNELTEMVNDIQSRSEIKIGTSLDTKYVDQLNDMLANGKITEEQMNKILGGIGYSPTVSYKTVQGPETRTEHRVTAKLGDNEIPIGTVVDYSRSDVQVPQIEGGSNNGGNAPKYVGAPSSSGINYSQGAGRRAAVADKNKNKKKSGKKNKEEKLGEKDLTKGEADRYHKVNTQLEKVNNQLKLIQSQEKKLTGQKLIDNINKQLGKLQKNMDLTKEKMKIARKEQEELQKKLSKKGVLFNDDGTISNYMEIYKSQLKELNDLERQYNKAKSKEEQEAIDKKIKAKKEEWEQFTKDLDRNDELASSFIPELAQQYQDDIDQMIEGQIKKFNIEFEARLDITEALKDWAEFKKQIDRDFKQEGTLQDLLQQTRASAEYDLTPYVSGSAKNPTGQLPSDLRRTQLIMQELAKMDENNGNGWSDVYGDDRATAMEELKEAYQSIEQDLLSIQEIESNIYNSWLDAMDKVSENLKDQLDMYEQISNIVDHDMKVIELVYGDDYEALGRQFAMKQQNLTDQVEFSRKTAEFWRAEMDNIDKNTDPNAWQKARDNWIEAVNDTNAAVEAAIENAQAKAENAADAIFKKTEKYFTNGKGYDYIQKTWDLQKTNAEQYLDTVNEAFAIRQLERKYQTAIDNTDNIKSQQKIRDIMQEQLKLLYDKDKVTQYDIDRANKMYEIEMKRLELEEARNTKTTMRLRRDSQGNYRYEYVADEDKLGQLKDELDALENSLYNFDKERYLSLQNEIVGLVQERENAIKEILLDASLTEEERQAKMAEVWALYNEQIEGMVDMSNTAKENLYNSSAEEIKKTIESQGDAYENLKNRETKEITDEMIPNLESDVEYMTQLFTDPDNGFGPRSQQEFKELSNVTNDYIADLEKIETAADVSFKEVHEGVDEARDKTKELIEPTDELITKYQEQLHEMEAIKDNLAEQVALYNQLKSEAAGAAEAAQKYLKASKEVDEYNAKKENNKTTGGTDGKGGNGNNSGNGTGGKNSSGSDSGDIKNKDKIEQVAATIWIWGGNNSGWYNGSDRVKRLQEKFGVKGAQEVQNVINEKAQYGKLNSTWDWDWLKNNRYYGKFNTGGYTGNWIGDGKFAMLHQKELVLNAKDTENMLDMMKIARDVISSVGANVFNQITSLRAGTISPNAAAASGDLEQHVQIEANFPGVQSAAEIEEALNNLVNLAAQRANQNRR